ncbi:MAG: hypothetical protein JRI76_08950 [Deltaproteobacteria bacterium]|nr:hypothetical protein [Deltaproteobacteria bacterium]MBW1954487.1 hypothetical protein [Deltaproteobacteria bacterium]MBW2042146.1 hypothetical protein [Deltaproteobacteria bacterium]MBW2132025.1 hypothetical protein [Deltaproteobacteria bacterium]
MKSFLAKLETIWMAVTFAEAGEWDTARALVEPPDKRKEREKTRSKRIYVQT